MDFDVAGNHSRLRLDDAVEVGNARNGIDQPGGPVVAVVGFKGLAGSFDALPGFGRIVIDGDEYFHKDRLLLEIYAFLGEGFGVLFFEDEVHFLDQIVTQGRDHLTVGALVHHGGTGGLLVDPGAVVYFAAAYFDVFTGGGFDLDFEEGGRIGETLLVGEAGHAVGADRTAGDGIDHGPIASVKVVFELVAFVAVGGGSGPEHVGFVDIRPMDAADLQALVEIFDGAEPLGADVVSVLRADIAGRLDQAHDIAVVVVDDHFGRVGEDGDGIVTDDIDLGHGILLHRCFVDGGNALYSGT